MDAAKERTLQKPGLLSELVYQLESGDSEIQYKAAELLLCIVGQGPEKDEAAIGQVSASRSTVPAKSIAALSADNSAAASLPFLSIALLAYCIYSVHIH